MLNAVHWRRWMALALLLLCAACGGPPELPVLAPGARVLAFGDSLTYGTGAAPEESYPSVLAALIDRDVVNAGVPGELSGDGLRRLPGVLDEVRPQLLILCHGGNDILRGENPETIRRNLEAMVGLARERGVPVLLIGVPERRLFTDTAEFYRQLAESLKLPLEDAVIKDIIGQARLKSDTVHPNAAGYRYLAESVHKLMRKTGAVR